MKQQANIAQVHTTRNKQKQNKPYITKQNKKYKDLQSETRKLSV